MAIQRYPLLYWPLGSDAVYGMVVGTAFHGVESNLKRLSSQLSDTMRRAAERDDDLDAPAMDEPRLRWVSVDVNLAHSTEKGNFPLPRAVTLRVAAVYGSKKEDSYSVCYLPYLGTSFYYYDDAQLGGLIEHYTREHVDGMSPEEVKAYNMPAPPQLDSVDHKPREHSRHDVAPYHVKEARAQLCKLADPMPEPARSGARGFPEAAWEQSALVDQLCARLVQGGHLLLVGERGVGKSVVIQEAIRKAHRQLQVAEVAGSFWRSNAERLIGRAKYLGEWQALCDQAIQWLDTVHGVLWVTDFVNLMHVGGAGAEDSMAAYLLPAMQTGRLRLVGEVHPQELAVAQQKLPGFMACFEAIVMPEMDAASARRVLEIMAAYSEQNLSVAIEPHALETGYRLLKRFVRYERFPGKAMHFFSDTVRHALADQHERVTESMVLRRFAARTGLPERFLRDDQPLHPSEVADFFGARLFGQAHAVQQLNEVICTFKAGLNDEAKPIVTLLLAGPTGVGKTEAAKALATFFFGAAGDAPLLRIDMSEFQHPFQVARLIGHGNQPGKLVEQVRQNPFSVILLDEIEKADPSVFDVLLSVLDEGRLRDDRGRETDFRNTLILMTTNLGVRNGASIGFSETGGDTLLHDIRSFFRPEFFNRIDRVIPFAPLGTDAVRQIAAKELAAIEQREGLLRRGIRLEFTTAVLDYVSAVGFSPVYGARPLQRAVEQHVVAALARFFFGSAVKEGRYQIDLIEGQIVLTARV